MAQVDKGENARMSSFVGAIAIADLVKSTLGPKGVNVLCDVFLVASFLDMSGKLFASIHKRTANNSRTMVHETKTAQIR